MEESKKSLLAEHQQELNQTEASETTKAKVPKKDNPTLGVIFFIASGLSFACNFIFAKVIYENKPQTTPFQVLAYRSIISSGLMLIKVNRNVKYVMYDSIQQGQWYPLWARTIQGNITIFINFTSIKFFSLTLVAVVNNFAPLVTVVLAYFILCENLKTYKLVQLFVAFGGCLLMILATPALEDDKSAEQGHMSWDAIFKYICLVLNPIFVAYGTVMMRQMRSLDENVVSCYMNSFAIPVMIALCYATGGDLSAWKDFEGVEWFCIFALSVSVIMSQTFRFKAFQNEETAKLQPLQFLNPVYQLIGDLAIFSAVFNTWQIVGMSIVCLVFFAELVYNWTIGSKKKPAVESVVSQHTSGEDEDSSFKKSVK